MLSRTIAAFCIIDDALQAMGYKDDPQAKTPASAILTLAILAAMELGGKHNGRVKCMCKGLCTGAYRS
jgi:hypothetical protein